MFMLNNPDYYKKEKLGKWTGSTPKTISLYEWRGNVLTLPFGALCDVWEKHPYKTDWICDIKPIEVIEYKSNINLYPYQEKAVNTVVSAKNGILVMPTGSGKTQVGIEIISRISGRALWLTHTQDLLNQSKKRAEDVLDVPGNKPFGTITEGKVDIGTHVTFATVQTMCKVDLSRYRNCFDVIIVDEVHHCAGSPTRVTQFYKVLSSLSARYKIGLTATPKRADGLERSMFALLGDKAYEVTREEVADTTCPVVVERYETGYMPDLDRILNGDGTINYSEVVSDLIENEDRTRFVVDKINEHADDQMIVLANRVVYLERLKSAYKGKAVCLSGAGQSKKAKAERKEALRKLNDGEINAVFATYQLAKEGLDVPNLRYVVFSTPEKDETTIIQSAGRVGRKADGKDCGTVIDFVDGFGMFKSWAKKRISYYKKIGVNFS